MKRITHLYKKIVPIQKNKLLIQIGIVVILLVGIISIASLNVITIKTNIGKEADKIIKICEKDSYRPACYDEEIPKVLDRGFSYEDAFRITALIQKQDTSFWYCHVLGHNLSAKETAKDVSKWTEVVARAPRGMCSNGSIHGAFQQRFRGTHVTAADLDKLMPEIKSICNKTSDGKDFTGMEQASCYHGLGHLSMYITNGEIDRSLKLCDRITKGGQGFSNLCYDGAFMQIFQPLEPEDVALVRKIAPKTQTKAKYFCDRFAGTKKSSCLSESWPLFIDSFTQKKGTVESFCSQNTTEPERTRCKSALFYVMAARTNFEPQKVKEICSFVTDSDKAQCYANSASRFLETDFRLAKKAVAVCNLAQEEGVGGICFDELLFYSAYNYIPGSSDHSKLCSVFPSPWKEKCNDWEGQTYPIPIYK